MRFKTLALVIFCCLGQLALATEKDKPTQRKDSSGKETISVDSITVIIIKDNDKEKVRLDDTLVFDDEEAPKGNHKGFVLNKKTGDGFKQNAMMTTPDDDEKGFNAEPKNTEMANTALQMPVEVFPNPTIAKLGTNLILPYEAQWMITITQVNGQTTPQILPTTDTVLLVEVPVSGVYIVKAVEGDTILYKRLIVQ
jgi:hypothetical protein